MGRVKIPMTPINDIKKRKLTFERRKIGMIKKELELTILCDVNVSMIIFTDDQGKPEIFPAQKLNSLIDLYRKKRSADCGKIKSYDLSSFFKDRNIQMEQELATAKKNLETKYPTWFDFLNNFPEEGLKDFAFRLQDKIDFVKNKIESIKKASKIQKLDQ